VTNLTILAALSYDVAECPSLAGLTLGAAFFRRPTCRTDGTSRWIRTFFRKITIFIFFFTLTILINFARLTLLTFDAAKSSSLARLTLGAAGFRRPTCWTVDACRWICNFICKSTRTIALFTLTKLSFRTVIALFTFDVAESPSLAGLTLGAAFFRRPTCWTLKTHRRGHGGISIVSYSASFARTIITSTSLASIALGTRCTAWI
jgi:hypothetical protein